MINKIINKAALVALFDDARQKNKLIIIDFFAEWCGPCKVMAPFFERLSTELQASCIFVQIDIDQSRDLAIEYSIQSIPTIIAINESEEIGRLVGSKSYDALNAWIGALQSGEEDSHIILREQLQQALQQTDADKVKELIEKDVNVKRPFESHLTPLYMAILCAAKGDGEKSGRIIELLLNAGAEWDASLAGGMSLIDFLTMAKRDAEKTVANYTKVIEYLER